MSHVRKRKRERAREREREREREQERERQTERERLKKIIIITRLCVLQAMPYATIVWGLKLLVYEALSY